MIRFYQEATQLDTVDLDYRVKSKDSCLRKYEKLYPEMRLEKIFNDVLGFRMLVNSYGTLLEGNIPKEMRIVDMSQGNAKDDGYRGIHLYYQPSHRPFFSNSFSKTYPPGIGLSTPKPTSLLCAYYLFTTFLEISVDELLFPDKGVKKSTQRRQLDGLLDGVSDNGLRIITATTKEIKEIEKEGE